MLKYSGHTGVLHYIAGCSNWKPLMRPSHRSVVWHWAHSTLEASFTKASTCKRRIDSFKHAAALIEIAVESWI